MLRTFASACVCLALALIISTGESYAGKAVKNQMVKGTVKLVDTGKSLLVVSQKVKNENVDRELSILETTKFVITDKSGKKEASGKDGLALLDGRAGVVGSSVQVKCDKDVNVLQVSITLK